MITVLDLAIHRGAKYDDDGRISGEAINDVGLPFWGGCELCAATIAAYNAHPCKSGYLRCSDCIGKHGWTSCDEANHDIFENEDEDEYDY